MRDQFAQTAEVVDVRPLRRRRHVFEAQIDGLDQAETAVDDAHGGDAVETVAYDAAARRRRLRRRPEGTDAEFGGVGGPEVDAVAVDAEVVVLGADADERPEDVDGDDMVVVFAGVTHGQLEVRHAHSRVDVVWVARVGGVAVAGYAGRRGVAAEADVQERRRGGSDAVCLFDEFGEEVVLASLHVDWKRVPRNVAVDFVELRQRVEVVLSSQAVQVGRADLRNLEGASDQGHVEVLRLYTHSRTGDWHGFTGAIAALNGLLRAVVDGGPVDWRLGVCVL